LNCCGTKNINGCPLKRLLTMSLNTPLMKLAQNLAQNTCWLFARRLYTITKCILQKP
jgi:hypothetical protein